MQSNDELQLAAEMAVVSTVKSTQLVEMARDSAQLQNFQDRLEDSKDRVDIVKKVLTSTPPSMLDIPTATQMDNFLQRSNVDLPVDDAGSVVGVECLGFTLLPAEYIKTRLAGCENFLADFFRKGKEYASSIGRIFRESYLVFTESIDSLTEQVEFLEKRLARAGTFKAGTSEIMLGTRLFNLFKVNEKVDENWVANVTKLNNTISALSSNYLLSNKNFLNNTMSYFGGFDGVGQEEGKERFLLLPKTLVSARFKDCSYPNKDYTTGKVVAKQSVELMGGAYFLDIRREKVNNSPTDIDGVQEYVTGMISHDRVGFENSAPVSYPRIGAAVKTLSSSDVASIIKLLKDTLKSWQKAADGLETYRVDDAEFSNIVKAIYESQMDDELKSIVQSTFMSIVRHNQTELLTTRASVNNYLVLVFNGLIELCETSISANAPQ